MRAEIPNAVSLPAVILNASEVLDSVIDGGRGVVVTKADRPACLITPIETVDRLVRLQEAEADLHLLALVLERVATDPGDRFDLDDVIAELGIDEGDEDL